MDWPACLQVRNAHHRWTGQFPVLPTLNGLASLSAGQECPITDRLASFPYFPS
jgi:hypothetical protein